MHRDDLVIAVGGEATGDIAGFVAATFNRGMRLALVPTTLAAQADSAVGGKNAINLGLGRNLVGTIHQPVVVISDIEVACANAGRGFKAGLAEIAKHALISPSDLLGYLQGARAEVVGRDPDAVCAAATRSVEIKADIVSRDERERGDRLFLNYGHTFAHAIELVRDTTADDQGESVALGMMAAAYLAFRQGRIPESVVDQHRQLIAGLGLPVSGEFKLQDLQQAWMRDKKYRHGIRFVVLNALGRPESGVTADEATLEQVLTDLAKPKSLSRTDPAWPPRPRSPPSAPTFTRSDLQPADRPSSEHDGGHPTSPLTHRGSPNHTGRHPRRRPCAPCDNSKKRPPPSAPRRVRGSLCTPGCTQRSTIFVFQAPAHADGRDQANWRSGSSIGAPVSRLARVDMV